MSVKIRVSHTNENELQQVLALLRPVTKKYKTSKERKGEHMNTYIYLK